MSQMRMLWLLVLEELGILLDGSFLHVASLVFFGRSAWNFLCLCHESSFEFFNLFSVFDNLTFDLRYDIFAEIHTRICLLVWASVGRDRFAIKGSPWNLWSTLHFGRQVSSFEICELILNLTLSIVSKWTTFIIVIYILVRRINH